MSTTLEAPPPAARPKREEPEEEKDEIAAPPSAPVPSPPAPPKSPAPQPPQHEKIFGADVIKEADRKAMKAELKQLFEAGTPQSHFQAAQLLAHLKRAGIGLAQEKGRKRAQELLLSSREALGQAAPLEQARYLGYLHYLGMLDQVTAEEQQRLEQAAANEQDPATVAMLLVWSKQLGLNPAISPEQQALLQKDAREKSLTANQQVASAFARGRLQYLELDSPLTPEENVQATQALAAKQAQYAHEEKWQEYANVRNLDRYLGGTGEVREPAVKRLLGHVTTVRYQKNWQNFAEYLGNVAQLKQPKRPTEPVDPVVAYLQELQKQDIPSPREFLGRISIPDQVPATPAPATTPPAEKQPLSEEEANARYAARLRQNAAATAKKPGVPPLAAVAKPAPSQPPVQEEVQPVAPAEAAPSLWQRLRQRFSRRQETTTAPAPVVESPPTGETAPPSPPPAESEPPAPANETAAPEAAQEAAPTPSRWSGRTMDKWHPEQVEELREELKNEYQHVKMSERSQSLYDDILDAQKQGMSFDDWLVQRKGIVDYMKAHDLRPNESWILVEQDQGG